VCVTGWCGGFSGCVGGVMFCSSLVLAACFAWLGGGNQETPGVCATTVVASVSLRKGSFRGNNQEDLNNQGCALGSCGTINAAFGLVHCYCFEFRRARRKHLPSWLHTLGRWGYLLCWRCYRNDDLGKLLRRGRSKCRRHPVCC
jgi:hypothetical protein